MRVLLVTHNGAQRSRVAAINHFKGLLVTAPTGLPEELRGLSTAQLINVAPHADWTAATRSR